MQRTDSDVTEVARMAAQIARALVVGAAVLGQGAYLLRGCERLVRAAGSGSPAGAAAA